MVEDDVARVVELSLAAWAPVFASFQRELGLEIYRRLYPNWQDLQGRSVEAVCRDSDKTVLVAEDAGTAIGFVAVAHVEEAAARAGEIWMLAVDPDRQREGVGTALMQRALIELQDRGLDLIAIGTGGDPGHAPARALYERFGFVALPQVRYYRRP